MQGEAVTGLWWLPLAGFAALTTWFAYRYEPAPWCWVCGCDDVVHRHHRDGTDCGHCGPKRCPAFSAPFIRRSRS